MSYPIVLVDEAQDLSAERSRMIAAMAGPCRVLLAFDEFQCLNPDLRPMPIGVWLAEVCVPTSLTVCQRTNDADLLEAAWAVRNGTAVNREGRNFKVVVTPSKPYAATYLANAIAWRQGGDVIILTPSRSGGFADGVVNLVCTQPMGKRQNGPFPIQWESSDEKESADLWRRLEMPKRWSVPDALTGLEPHCDVPAMRTVREWVAQQRRILGVQEVTAEEVRRKLNRTLAARRRYGGRAQAEFVAMTIPQAKNREFDHVVVIWPYTVPNDDEQKRRLLYNAITRAKRSCHVLVQAQKLCDAPPFVG